MRLILFLLLVLLVVQVGFWQAFGAVLGAIAIFFLIGMLFVAALIVAGVLFAASSIRG